MAPIGDLVHRLEPHPEEPDLLLALGGLAGELEMRGDLLRGGSPSRLRRVKISAEHEGEGGEQHPTQEGALIDRGHAARADAASCGGVSLEMSAAAK